MTETEKIVWERLSKNKAGVRIRRQHPIYKYIADFYCHEVKLVIEIDGGIHGLKRNKENDASRDDVMLNQFRIKVLRFTNREVINTIDRLIIEIKNVILQHRP